MFLEGQHTFSLIVDLSSGQGREPYVNHVATMGPEAWKWLLTLVPKSHDFEGTPWPCSHSPALTI